MQEVPSRSGISMANWNWKVVYQFVSERFGIKKFPAVFLPGRGDYGIQPVFVEDLAQLAVDAAGGEDDLELDAVGPEVFTYAGMVELVRDKIKARCLVLSAPKPLTYAAGRALGMLLGDIVLTRDEIKGLSAGLLVSKSEAEPPGRTRLSEWLDGNGDRLGRRYASEIQRHYR